MTGWGIHRLADMIGSQQTETGLPDGRWVRAVPEPYTGARLKAAWAVLRGVAYAVHWPKAGDLERALAVGSGNVTSTSIKLTRAEIQSGLSRVKWAEGLILFRISVLANSGPATGQIAAWTILMAQEEGTITIIRAISRRRRPTHNLRTAIPRTRYQIFAGG